MHFWREIHDAQFIVVSITHSHLEQEIRVYSIQIEISPIRDAFIVRNTDPGIIVSSWHKRLVQHIVLTFFKETGVILHLRIQHQAVFHRRFAVIHVVSKVCIAVVR